VLAITGTNGKTTVTALTGQLVARSGQSVKIAGNIGPTLLDTLAQALLEAEAHVKLQEEQATPALVHPMAQALPHLPQNTIYLWAT
jgi:UDP-N-acetylmuramoylalanine--D-glutamate ligase